MAQIHAEVSSPENTELPQRSRNARAQARHRAKRKAYIEKLENNVAKLQAILGLTSDQVSDLPPAAVLSNRYAELELENHRLHEQLRALQQVLHGRGYGVNSHNGAEWSPNSPTVAEFPTQALPINGNDQNYGRDTKKRKISCEEEMPFTDGHHPLGAANDLSTNGLASRAHPLQTSVSHASARGHSADTNTTPFSSTTYNQQPNGPATGPLNPISIKTEPPQFGEMSILSPTMAASPLSIQRAQHQHQQQQQQQQQQQHINTAINMNGHHTQGQGMGLGQYRMSFSPTSERGPSLASAETYSGIVGNTARTIFGSSDDEAYLPVSQPGHPTALDSRLNEQQQYLAHERLASLAQQGQQHNQRLPQAPNGVNSGTGGYPHQHHQQHNGIQGQANGITPMGSNNPYGSPAPRRMSVSQALVGTAGIHSMGMYGNGSGTGSPSGLSSPVVANGGGWPPVMTNGKRM